jgi:hypothetical protein
MLGMSKIKVLSLQNYSNIPAFSKSNPRCNKVVMSSKPEKQAAIEAFGAKAAIGYIGRRAFRYRNFYRG